jgi:hypothetical protein
LSIENADETITPDHVFNFYRTIYVPAYADLVGYIGKKPDQVMVEIENTLAHLSQFYNPGLGTEEKNGNLKKALSHLTRATLDCYKLLWWKMNDDLTKIFDNVEACAFFLNIPEDKFIHEYQEFKTKAQIARKKELECVGVDPLESVKLYKESIIIGEKLIGYIDGEKKQKFDKFRRIFKVKEYAISFISGVITGLFANYIWNLFLKLYPK